MMPGWGAAPLFESGAESRLVPPALLEQVATDDAHETETGQSHAVTVIGLSPHFSSRTELRLEASRRFGEVVDVDVDAHAATLRFATELGLRRLMDTAKRRGGVLTFGGKEEAFVSSSDAPRLASQLRLFGFPQRVPLEVLRAAFVCIAPHLGRLSFASYNNHHAVVVEAATDECLAALRAAASDRRLVVAGCELALLDANAFSQTFRAYTADFRPDATPSDVRAALASVGLSAGLVRVSAEFPQPHLTRCTRLTFASKEARNEAMRLGWPRLFLSRADALRSRPRPRPRRLSTPTTTTPGVVRVRDVRREATPGDVEARLWSACPGAIVASVVAAGTTTVDVQYHDADTARRVKEAWAALPLHEQVVDGEAVRVP